MRNPAWSEAETVLAMDLYLQVGCGVSRKNPEVRQLANLIGRTEGAVTRKLANIASCDPGYVANGRVGLPNRSKTDEMIWNRYHDNQDALRKEKVRILEELEMRRGL